MTDNSPEWVDKEWLRNQIRWSLRSLHSWVVRYGYRLTEEEAEMLEEILKAGSTKDEG